MSVAHPSVIVVVGAGQLGSRYLQGLAKCTSALSIWVVDPQGQALALAKERWEEVRGAGSSGLISWCQSLDDVPQQINVAIVATSANVRAGVIERLCGHAAVDYWILEKVLAQSPESVNKIVRLTRNAKGCWVNTPRRLMSWHRRLYEQFENGHSINATYGGGMWGMACNAIHFLDLVAWWRGADLERIDTDGLDPQWMESKRQGFFEVTGRLVASYSDGSTLTLISGPEDSGTTLVVDTSAGCWVIDEAKGQAVGPDMKVMEGRLEYQSEMTTALVDDLLHTGRCNLPTLAVSAKMHVTLLSGLLQHWNENSKRVDRVVPVT